MKEARQHAYIKTLKKELATGKICAAAYQGTRLASQTLVDQRKAFED